MSESKLKVQVLEGTDNKLDLAKLEDVEKNKEEIKSDYKLRMKKAKLNQKGKNITDVLKDVVNDDD